VYFQRFYRTIFVALHEAHPMTQSSENLQYSLQLVNKHVDGKPILAGHGELHGNEFDMLTRVVDGLLLFNFDPTDDAVKEAGVFALLSLLEQLPSDQRIVFVSPGSRKSEEMVREVVEAYRTKTGIDHTLFILEKSENDPNLRDGGFAGHVQAYVPVTVPDEIRYLSSTPEQEAIIKQEVEDGAVVVSLDDIFSTGETLLAIDKLLGQIGVPVSHRFAVGTEVPAVLIERQGDELVWKPDDSVEAPEMDVKTAFALPLFAGEDVTKIIHEH
jgi:hypothetical protein